jgi:hypothetical protein
MFANFLMKKPILVVGILMFAIFIMRSAGHLPFFNRSNLGTTACHGAIVRLERELPKDWDIYCEENNLTIEVDEDLPNVKPELIKETLYQLLANHFVLLSRSAENDLMEKIFIVRFKLKHHKLEINAISEGKYVAKLASLNSKEFIVEHLKQTVQVNDVVK